jgi:hypothetical protein
MPFSYDCGCCVIGIEVDNEYVRWVSYENRDGSFSVIVPILRTYTKRSDVEKLIDLGFQAGLPVASDQLEAVYNTESLKKVGEPPKVALSRHEFYDEDATLYRYIFTNDNKWICRAPDFFDMDILA